MHFISSVCVVIFFTLMHIFPADTSAEVVFFDSAIPLGKSGTLKALTKGRFFPEGGKIVEFFADEKKIGRTLSGGDGFAFLRYVPATRGVQKIRVSSGVDSDEGSVAVIGNKDRTILFEIESTLFTRPLSFEPQKEGKEALQELSKRFLIIYISGLLDAKKSRSWLREKGLPLFPVFPPGTKDITEALKEEGISVYAVVASPAMISRAQYAERKFSFEETENAEVVKDWKELLKKLKE